MKRFKKGLILVLCLTMAALMFVGCVPKDATGTSEEPASEEPATVDSNNTDEVSSESTDALVTAAKEELYSLLPKIALVGVRDDSSLESRADIDKAWPKKLATPNTLVIGWSEVAMANPWFVAVKDSAIATAEAKGYTINFLVAEGDAVSQSQHIDTFITQGVDVIVIDPVDTTAVILDIKRAVDAGIPVVCVGAAPSGEAPILTTISDNAYQVGYGAGEYAGGTFDKDEPISIGAIPGALGNTTAESRTHGMVGGVIAARQKAQGKFICKEDAILKGFKLWEDAKKNGSAKNEELNVAILNIFEGGWSQEGGLAAAEPMLAAVGSKLNLMIADNEFMCFGILKAVEAAGLTDQIKVGAPSDGFNDALRMIDDGTLLVSGSRNGDQQGAHAIEFRKRFSLKEKIPATYRLAHFSAVNVYKGKCSSVYKPDPNANFFAVPEFVFPASIDELKAN